jgi:hypothetical protein
MPRLRPTGPSQVGYGDGLVKGRTPATEVKRPRWGTIDLADPYLSGKGLKMIIFMENIAPPPPLVQVPDEEISKLAERLTQDDRWVKNLIAGLAGVL